MDVTLFNQNKKSVNNSLRQPPQGWPVGSFSTYKEAQDAVDMLSDRGDFPVNDLTIVGVDLMEVERVIGRLTWGRVLFSGAVSGSWLGLFLSALIAFVAPSTDLLTVFLYGIIGGGLFGIISAAATYASSAGKRDFASRTEIIAGRYDVLCLPNTAPRARDLIEEYLRTR